MEKTTFWKANKSVFITKSSRETQRLAEDFSTHARVLALYGELGSGKTTFVQGLAKGLGVKQRIISPTFVIVRNYELGIMNYGMRSFYHVDLYRIESPKHLAGLGLEDIINDRQNVVIIEWAERMGDLLPKNRVDIRFEYINEGKRRITIR